MPKYIHSSSSTIPKYKTVKIYLDNPLKWAAKADLSIIYYK
jgi:hypothetical protein